MNGNTSQESQPPPLQDPDLTSKQTAHDHYHHQQPSFSTSPDQDHPTSKADGTSTQDEIADVTWWTPAVPTLQPNNQKAALWGTGDQYEYQYHHYPYLHYTPLHDSSSSSSSSVIRKFNSWSRKAEANANNIWHNLKTGPSVPGAAWAKVNLATKAITGGGFESLYKQTFNTPFPSEKLKKTFACYLSTSSGHVSGTLYLSNIHMAFCSDRPLSFTAPSGQQTWSYYKVLIPLGNIGSLNPVIMTDNTAERYIQAVTVDQQDFWFMGFVNYEKAASHLYQSISTFGVSEIPVKQQPVAA
ncbi:hypothetical protein ACH5RR_010911 [Cinchona calisaya]|uniref:GRAM domain-containing protein n=1 Tax=Cinchona calisaya TaxID=153742 RepID=A0ABD3A6U2_9GENT